MNHLDRASPAYARGFRDCRDNRPKLFDRDGTFYGYDYDEGWWASFNEQYWDAVAENKTRGDVCPRCQIVIRPDGGHCCGTCGRNI